MRFVGQNMTKMLEEDNANFVFRFHRDRVYFIRAIDICYSFYLFFFAKNELLTEHITVKIFSSVSVFHNCSCILLSDDIMKMAERIPRKQLISVGVCFGKFTKTKKFRLLTTCLDYLAHYASAKAWLSSAGEQSYVYGNNVIKRHLLRITEDIPKNCGVVIFSPNEVPIGFGVTAKTADEMRNCDTEAIVVFHQADVGEYLRDEADLV
ncbi:putative 60S ribosome subunit biogenesis protein NIP7 [Cardiosporidium cionae]|uniref:60S ribosome subunit biogenesis protein NIP7 homolog n=1 Tax=Cardiosporidium cionae TaxID=476202 RepID=A0ABQ7J5A4_9APIC|nr:putative 60S ribosome subunit biogenesis protein NIP7 [Cardiosporidium cionae]|eukprot:KAF8819120.1 putative 60S ribosome subunit biogenesis protein NIP7 [Cardiosporidium cionae]